MAKKCKKSERRLSWNMRGVAGAEGPQGPQGAPGQPGAAGAPATKLFATVMADGAIDASSPGVRVYHLATGAWEVNFGQDVSHCAAVAGIGAVPIYTTPGSATGRNPGYALADLASGGSTDPGGNFPSDNTVIVETFSGSTDALADTSFDVAVFC